MSKESRGLKRKEDWNYGDGNYKISFSNVTTLDFFISHTKLFSMKPVKDDHYNKYVTCKLCATEIGVYNANFKVTRDDIANANKDLLRHLEFNHEMTVTDLEEVHYGTKSI